jgi:hypothetical protein
MENAVGFRQDLVNEYVSKIDGYLAVQQQTRSAATTEGAAYNLRVWAAERGMPALSESEDKAVQLAIRELVTIDQGRRTGEKRIDHVECVREEARLVFFHITYSDRLVVETSASRTPTGALTRSAPWDRGEGWPLVPLERAVDARNRWIAANSTENRQAVGHLSSIGTP